MTFRHMRIFLQVYQTQNITRAAKLLNMSQPAVTRAIQEVEQYYGIRLFERINRRLTVTEIGHRFYRQALHMLEAYDTMEKELKNWDRIGSVRIGATVTLGSYFLPRLAAGFRKEYPEIEIRGTISNGSSLERGLLNNELDLALVESSVDETELQAEPIGEDRLILITPPGHELLLREQVVLQDLEKYPVLLRERGSTVRTFLDNYFAVSAIQIHPVWESVSTQAIVKAVGCGIGISILPEKLVSRDLADGIVCTREIAEEELTRKHYIVWHKNKFLTKSMQRLIDYCRLQK
ncbi:MAG: LysR family transcriptional regulator [Lachnospiraceae bacterium]|nr:LysR family transcriptional regulator [Lachnospiraceae bacterium]